MKIVYVSYEINDLVSLVGDGCSLLTSYLSLIKANLRNVMIYSLKRIHNHITVINQKVVWKMTITNDRTVLTDIHIKHNRPDIIILNKQQKQAYLLDKAIPNSHNITQTYNTKINKYLELSVAMRNLWCLEKISILPLIISATGIVPQSLFKNLKILDLGNTLVVEIQKGILLYSCHIVRKFLNIDTEHNIKTQ
jgi:hypothetical protein